MARLKQAKSAMMLPFPDDMQEYIKKGKELVKGQDRIRWKIMFLVAEVEQQFGTHWRERFAVEIGISPDTAYEYARLVNQCGVTVEFLGKWMHQMSYTQIRDFLRFNGHRSVATIPEQEIQDYVDQHMNSWKYKVLKRDSSAITEEEHKAAQDKAKQWLGPKSNHEGWGLDELNKAVELIVEYPELEPIVQNTRLVEEQDWEQIELARARITQGRLIDLAAEQIQKLNKLRRDLGMNIGNLTEILKENVDNADEFQEACMQLAKLLVKIGQTKPYDVSWIKDAESIEIDLEVFKADAS